MGEGAQEVQTTTYKIGKLQGCNERHREYSQHFIVTFYGVKSIKIVNYYAVHLTLI